MKGGEMGQQFDGWCILRTRAGYTIRLAESLAADGFEVWTPIETKTVRLPRKNVRREIRAPIMGSYVFAKAHHLPDLIELSRMAVKPRRGAGGRLPAHADFHVMRCPGGIPTVPDAQFAALRRIEARRTPRPKAARSYRPGVTVRVEGGSFGGMQGKVERSDQAQTVITFDGGRFRLKLPTCILNDASLTG